MITIQKYKSTSNPRVLPSRSPTTKLISLEKALALEKTKSNDQENRNRKMNVEISGIPVKSNENRKTIVKEISNLLSTDLLLSDIDIAHRLTSSNTKIPPAIIARFSTRTARDPVQNVKMND